MLGVIEWLKGNLIAFNWVGVRAMSLFEMKNDWFIECGFARDLERFWLAVPSNLVQDVGLTGILCNTCSYVIEVR